MKSRVGAIGDLAQFPVEVVGKLGETATQIGGPGRRGAQKAVEDVSKKAATRSRTSATARRPPRRQEGRKKEPTPTPPPAPKKP